MLILDLTPRQDDDSFRSAELSQQVPVVFCEEAQDRQVNLWHNFYFYCLLLPLLRLLVLTFRISGKTGQSFENRLPLQLLLPLLLLLPLHEPL